MTYLVSRDHHEKTKVLVIQVRQAPSFQGLNMKINQKLWSFKGQISTKAKIRMKVLLVQEIMLILSRDPYTMQAVVED